MATDAPAPPASSSESPAPPGPPPVGAGGSDSPAVPAASSLSATDRINEIAKAARAARAAAPSEETEEAEPETPPAEEPAKEETQAPAASVEEPKQASRARQRIEESRARREAEAANKRARTLEARLQTVQEAASSWQSDPTKVLAALGIEPTQFVTRYAEHVAGITRQPDPVVEKVQAEVKPVLEQFEKEREALQQAQIQQRAQTMLNQHVRPLFNDDKYEAILAYAGTPDNAAAYVLNECVAEFMRSGTNVPFAVAADALEKWHAEQIETTISAVARLKRFKGRFASQGPSPQATNGAEPGKTEQQKPAATSRTLHNGHAPTVQPPNAKLPAVSSFNGTTAKNARIEEVLKQVRARA